MKRLFCLFLSFLLLSCFSVSARAEGEFDPSAKAYCLAEIDTGKIISSKNADVCLPMASTTKIMTALVAIESGRLDDIVLVTDDDVKVEGSSLSLRSGDVLTLGNIVRGMMAVSGNDAAHTIARFLGGSDEGFAEMMNDKAKKLGMENTNFENPHGLPDENHYTTAYDMVLLTSAALKNSIFLDIVSSYKTEITYLESVLGYTSRKLTNTNKLLNLVEGCIGVKTGYTLKSGRCLVSAVRREGAGVICVVLNCPNYWEDSKTLLEYGMTKVTYADIITDTVEYELNVVGGSLQTVRVQNTEYLSGSMLKSDYEAMRINVRLPKFVYAPIKSGDEIGDICVTVNGEIIASIPIIATQNISRVSFTEGLKDNFKDMLLSNISWMYK